MIYPLFSGLFPGGFRRTASLRLRVAGTFLISASAWFLPGSRSAASELERFDFSLRFPAAISRFASYADVAAMGNAQAASEWSSSINPASAAWPHAGRKYTRSFSPQANALRFNSGTNLYVLSEALTVDTGAHGVFLPGAAQISSNHRTDRFGFGFRFEADFFQLQWAKLIAPDTTVGVNFNITRSKTTFDVADFVVARSEGESYNFRLGILQRIAPAVRLGSLVEYGSAPGSTDGVFFDPFTGAPQAFRAEDTTEQILVRTGIAWEYSPGSTLCIDYQGGWFRNDTGTLRVHRFPIGIEHLVIKDILFLRAGATIDTRGDVAGTAGLGLSLSDRATIDVAYQKSMFPELRPEFGSAETFTLSVGVSF